MTEEISSSASFQNKFSLTRFLKDTMIVRQYEQREQRVLFDFKAWSDFVH